MLDVGALSTAFLVGFLPVFIWLGFWLWQDKKHPEPRTFLIRAFVVGMVSVALVIPLQKAAGAVLPVGFLLIFLWAATEEIVKFFVVWLAVLRTSTVDEPIDIPMYLITAALGFAAIENSLFLLGPIVNGNLEHGLITGNLRFIGATLIHVLSSATIGVALALAYFKEVPKKILYGVAGVILAILLHTLFNFSIIRTGTDWLLTIFAGVWVGIVFLLFMLEKVKLLKRPAWWEKMFIRR